MENTRISIVIPVYNKAPFLERCLDSVYNQTDTTAEAIIVDDGSDDGSEKICKKYEKLGFILYRTKHKGVSEARNYGMDKSSGDYITFLDADDAYEPDALKTMANMTKDGKYNIIQFGQYKVNGGVKAPHPQSERGDYDLPKAVKYWEFTTNKLYKLDFLRKHKIRFIKGLQFGEDEMFNVEAFIANHGLRQSAVRLYDHYLDDKQSLCRGGLNREKLEVLDAMLRGRLAKLVKDGEEDWVDGAEWIVNQCRRHYKSPTFARFGFKQRPRGKHDVVYFVKECPHNEELRYSLRSLAENWKYRDVWFYGGCPVDLNPDHYVKCVQNAPRKWENVRNMMVEVCKNDDITEDFWLFNDDFFILKPVDEDMEAKYDGTLKSKIEQMQSLHHGETTEWSENLEKLRKLLESNGKSTNCYAIHVPMLINRKKMLEVLEMFPDEPMQRALYGNWWSVGGVQMDDPKYSYPSDKVTDAILNSEMISTSDESFLAGFIGRWLRDKFTERSEWER